MKSVKNLLAPFIILVALIIGVVIYYAVTNAGKNKPEETSSGVMSIVYVSPSELSSLSVYDSQTQHTSVVKSSNASGYITYEYQGDDAVPGEAYSQMGLTGYVEALTAFSSYAKVSTGGNFAEYGLDNPRFTVTINSLNGTVTTVYIGNKSPDGQYCYVYVAGTSDIYTVSSIKYAQAEKTAINFLETKALNIAYADLDTVHFDRKTDGLSLDAKVRVTSSGFPEFEVYKPYKHTASGYFATMVDRIASLEISEYIAIDKSELSKYGLADPSFHFILTMKDGQKTELFLSQKISGFYYGYLSGMDEYFMLSEYQLSGLELQELVLIDPYVCYYYATDLSSITFYNEDQSFNISLEVPSGESLISDKSTVTVDGRNAKISDSYGRYYCSILYESIACINIGGVELNADVDTSKEAGIRIEFIDNNYNITTYSFYTRNDDSYYVFMDGEYTGFYVYSREIFNNGGSDTYSYGCWSAYELLNEAIAKNINGIYDLPG